jgi:hypothetical protein
MADNLGLPTATSQQISDYWNANKANPQAIYDGLQQTNTSISQAAAAAGMSVPQFNQYLLGPTMADATNSNNIQRLDGTSTNMLGVQNKAPDGAYQSRLLDDPMFGFYGANGAGAPAGTPSGSAGGAYGAGGGGGGSGGTNPYLQGMGQNIINQMTENFTRNQMPALRSGAMAAGGFGGSRQGVIEANGLNDLNRGIGQNLTNMYGQDWTNQQNRNLQDKSINNSYDLGSRSLNNQYDLGLRSNDLGFASLDANIANSNFSNQLNAAKFGLNATNAQNNQTGAGIQAGTDIQQTPQKYQQYFSNQANQAGGQGGSSTGTQTGASNPYAAAIGGGVMGYDLYKQYQNSQPQATPSNYAQPSRFY